MRETHDTKFCSGCNTMKQKTQFHERKLSKDGLASRCKVCRNEDMRRRYEASKKGG